MLVPRGSILHGRRLDKEQRRLQREAAASTHKRSVYSINQAGGMRQMADNMAEDAARPLSPAQQHEEEEEHVEAADVEVLLRDRAEVSWAGMNDADAASTASSKGRSTNGDRGPQHRQVERRRLLTEMDETPERMVRAPNELLRK